MREKAGKSGVEKMSVCAGDSFVIGGVRWDWAVCVVAMAAVTRWVLAQMMVPSVARCGAK